MNIFGISMPRNSSLQNNRAAPRQRDEVACGVFGLVPCACNQNHLWFIPTKQPSEVQLSTRHKCVRFGRRDIPVKVFAVFVHSLNVFLTATRFCCSHARRWNLRLLVVSSSTHEFNGQIDFTSIGRRFVHQAMDMRRLVLWVIHKRSGPRAQALVSPVKAKQRTRKILSVDTSRTPLADVIVLTFVMILLMGEAGVYDR